MDEMTGGEIVLMDGQVTMRDKKMSPKEHTDLEVVVGDGLEIAIQSGKIKFQNSARNVLNSVKLGNAIKDAQMDRLMINAENKVLSKDDDNTSNKSYNSLKKPSSRSSLDEDKKDSEDLMGSKEELNKNGDLNGMAENVDADKLETATADVIISEYPSECYPEYLYRYCPSCLEETPFWIKWKAIRLWCYQLVEHKYFETLVITLILISSMALVCH